MANTGMLYLHGVKTSESWLFLFVAVKVSWILIFWRHGNATGKGGVVDRGSGVKIRSSVDVEDLEGDGIEEIVVEDTCGNTDGVTRHVMYLSPIKTVQTTHTVVGSNQKTVITVEEPKVGIVFRCWQEVEAYYKEYQVRFGVTRVQGVNSMMDKSMTIATTLKCECWGRPDMRARREAKKRGNGGWRFRWISLWCYGVWELKTVHLVHNHFIDPILSKLVKEYRMKHMTTNVKKKLLDYYEQGVPHEVYKERRLKMVGGDAVAMMEYFEKMQSDNQIFFHAQRLDEEGRLKDVLWVDARSRVAYENFGDVVCFDATYLTNEYELSFVNFVGVNLHDQSLLLGCALVSHEDCDTFAWIFRQWLTCMNKRAPNAILTDQAAAMWRPLAEVMPNTMHRWCIWHIMSKIPEKLGKYARYQEFQNPLKEAVYESLTPDEFHERWAALFLSTSWRTTNSWKASTKKV
ncbi:protein FAR-RED IMPAIRED RESPONSE 1-like, partial [Chenopodium quinoa]|uniref:protein FAR-RED IMPAIRED RESPONSE 1-like n=1 Tax=Chenopodium quinoa TaxID=63459 RepID=UPI000B77FD9D